MYSIVPLFSSPILTSKIDISAEKFESALKYVEGIEYIQGFDTDGHRNGFTSINQNLLNEPKMIDIAECVEKALGEYLFDVLKLDNNFSLKHQCSWSVKHEYGDKSHIHNHSNSLFSGVLYLKVPPDSGNYLTFYNEQTTFVTSTFSFPFSEYNIYNSKHWEFDVEEKTILIFPSHVHHKAPISRSYANRYCISFNYFVSGEMAEYTKCMNLF